MNILFLVDTGLSKVCRGGIERSTERCAREMISRGHKALVFSWKREKDMLATLPQEVFPREKPRNAKENRALFEKTLREERIDVVVFQCGAGWKFPFPREAAKLGPLSEYTLRLMEKQKKLPCIYSGRKCLINYDRLIEMLGGLGA